MHDVGKIGVPDSILLKESSLTPAEREVIQQHTTIGADILRGSASALLQCGTETALSHHERWDGKGYPHGLAGRDIPLYGRICAVADVFDALTSKRPYKAAFSLKKARHILNEGRGSQFDPIILKLFLANFEVVEAIHRQYQD
ncbi:MAG: HD domain-containing protein [Armatimonadetes bacterium]|nr:HD domain-containing protein [Armatimonadota bacterium]